MQVMTPSAPQAATHGSPNLVQAQAIGPASIGPESAGPASAGPESRHVPGIGTQLVVQSVGLQTSSPHPQATGQKSGAGQEHIPESVAVPESIGPESAGPASGGMLPSGQTLSGRTRQRLNPQPTERSQSLNPSMPHAVVQISGAGQTHASPSSTGGTSPSDVVVPPSSETPASHGRWSDVASIQHSSSHGLSGGHHQVPPFPHSSVHECPDGGHMHPPSISTSASEDPPSVSASLDAPPSEGPASATGPESRWQSAVAGPVTQPDQVLSAWQNCWDGAQGSTVAVHDQYVLWSYEHAVPGV